MKNEFNICIVFICLIYLWYIDAQLFNEYKSIMFVHSFFFLIFSLKVYN